MLRSILSGLLSKRAPRLCAPLGVAAGLVAVVACGSEGGDDNLFGERPTPIPRNTGGSFGGSGGGGGPVGGAGNVGVGGSGNVGVGGSGNVGGGVGGTGNTGGSLSIPTSCIGLAATAFNDCCAQTSAAGSNLPECEFDVDECVSISIDETRDNRYGATPTTQECASCMCDACRPELKDSRSFGQPSLDLVLCALANNVSGDCAVCGAPCDPLGGNTGQGPCWAEACIAADTGVNSIVCTPNDALSFQPLRDACNNAPGSDNACAAANLRRDCALANCASVCRVTPACN